MRRGPSWLLWLVVLLVVVAIIGVLIAVARGDPLL